MPTRPRVSRTWTRRGAARRFFSVSMFRFRFRHRRRVASATLVVASGARARRRGHGEAFPAPLHRLSGSVRAQQRALPRLLPARVLQRGAEQLPPAPPAQVAATRVVRVPESSGGGERLVVAVHHDELTSGVASLEPQTLQEKKDRDFITAAVQLVAHLHHRRLAAAPLVFVVQHAPRAQRFRRRAQIAVHIPDRHQATHRGAEQRTERFAGRAQAVGASRRLGGSGRARCGGLRVSAGVRAGGRAGLRRRRIPGGRRRFGAVVLRGASEERRAPRGRGMHGLPPGVEGVHERVYERGPHRRERRAPGVSVQRPTQTHAHRASCAIGSALQKTFVAARMPRRRRGSLREITTATFAPRQIRAREGRAGTSSRS